ncbi:cytidine deaminase [Rodentibacter caecimuris]|uniref:Cytidine deaminase n=1 Tax=Rodentibacter caecimuris TaxID=1796644 RepID=A0ABX3KVP6_9PAST|nr:cytidine deaminase [Rodentibacter heylii]
MSTTTEIKHRLNILLNSATDVQKHIIAQLMQQKLTAVLSKTFTQHLCEKYNISQIQLALECLPIATCYALPTISQFYVGALAIGKTGTFYFGANQEFLSDSIQQTIHAEQSAIAHAWLANESGISDMIVNYTPCGHCRQFMNELNTAEKLRIHLPHSQNNTLQTYLPDAFGPKNLDIKQVLFENQEHHLRYAEDNGIHDELIQAAVSAANCSYSPYSSTFSGIALQCGEKIIKGRYAENAAFNPSLPPLQSALNFRRLQGLSHIPISRIVLAEKTNSLSYRYMTEALIGQLFNLPLEYISLK